MRLIKAPDHLPGCFAPLEALAQQALDLCNAGVATRHNLQSIDGSLHVVTVGKAAARMAQAAEELYPTITSGLVLTRHGHGLPLEKLEVIEAGHPLPDNSGMAASEQILEMAAALGRNDTLLVLLSGGASALMTLPIPPITLAEKQAMTRALFTAGATIGELNCVRKHLSLLKGGRLAAAAFPANVVCVAVSDVPGDSPTVIGSGPTVPDPTTQADARSILLRYGVKPPDAVARVLTDPVWETPKPGSPDMAHQSWRLALAPADWLGGVTRLAARFDWDTIDLGAAVSGEARDVAHQHAALALSTRKQGRPTVIISGGELDVTGADGSHAGGRCREYALALACALDSQPGIAAVAYDSDGIDGSGDAAGAWVTPDTLKRARAAGCDAVAMLDAHQSGAFFHRTGEAIITGPTLTNVADIRMIAVVP